MENKTSLGQKINATLWLLGIMAYVAAGIFFSQWQHWFIFPAVALVGAIVQIICGERTTEQKFHALIWIVAIIVFLGSKFIFPTWDKQWGIFVLAVLLCGIVSVNFRKDGTDSKDSE